MNTFRCDGFVCCILYKHAPLFLKSLTSLFPPWSTMCYISLWKEQSTCALVVAMHQVMDWTDRHNLDIIIIFDKDSCNCSGMFHTQALSDSHSLRVAWGTVDIQPILFPSPLQKQQKTFLTCNFWKESKLNAQLARKRFIQAVKNSREKMCNESLH